MHHLCINPRLSSILGMGHASFTVTEFRYQSLNKTSIGRLAFWPSLLHTPTVIWMLLSYLTLVVSLSLSYTHSICVGSCASPQSCAVPQTPQALLHVQQKYNILLSFLGLAKTSSFRSSTSLMASCCSSVTLPLNCSISGKTGLSISIYSSVGLSGKFEQLESPSSVSDLNDFTRPDEPFIVFNHLIQIWSL